MKKERWWRGEERVEGGKGRRESKQHNMPALHESQGTHCMAHCSGSSEGSSNKPRSTSTVQADPRK